MYLVKNCGKTKMKRKHRFYLFALLPFALMIGIFATSFENFFSASFHREVDAFLQEQAFQGSILIAKGDKVLFKKGYGFANEEDRIPNTPQTIFRIGSITKQFTAIAILKLQELGKLNVYDPISKYLPDYPEGEKILIHHLLCHTSGIPSITDFPNLQEIQRYPSTPHQVIAYFKNLPLKFEPGTDCEYSDSGYIVLGAIIEEVANQSYEQFIQENILSPLGMHATYYDHNRYLIPKRAMGYEINDQGKHVHANYIDMSFPHAAGALATTVEDLYQLDRALQGAKLLSKKSTASLFLIHGSSQKHRMTYGYGFFIGPHNLELEQARGHIVGHYGTIEGFRAASFRYPDEDLTIILLSNVENTPVNELHLALAQIIRSTWRPCATF
jgi:CubicO group peptidase (beta-lactamase class C family)